MGKLQIGGIMFKKLFAEREEKDLTQEQMARIIKVDRSIISKWENNKEIIPLKHLNTYANYFNVSFDYLAGLSKIKQHENINKELNKKIIGKRIKEFREKNNLTLRQVAKILNTTSSTISAYEQGKVLIQTSFAYEIAKKYNISMDWLCGKTKGAVQ